MVLETDVKGLVDVYGPNTVDGKSPLSQSLQLSERQPLSDNLVPTLILGSAPLRTRSGTLGTVRWVKPTIRPKNFESPD